ncbi:OmpA family protein [Amycolatopsis sp. NPDC049691]|uniref:OmpA family protein n=1 Tax=Amycolatopsis sp. NPDC049691 TaxID=3155155 RepID=UPI00342BC5E8
MRGTIARTAACWPSWRAWSPRAARRRDRHGTARTGPRLVRRRSASSGAGAPSSPRQGTGAPAQQVTASIAQATQALGEIAKALQGNQVKISVATHAGYPDADQAKALSEKRAEAISSALEGLGVSKDRVARDATGPALAPP